ncbi:hypothetical protein [Halorubellus sp. PRR65]|uniref:hypothetical protein n=1 Tax=Halorubellus sp. PRR65 TaxID=3098148 RepID=UPI002B25AEA2|nr:hypothetical protein [Halorubellus sp. PRR65]
MVPSPRKWLRGPVSALRSSRALALAVALAVGAAALFAAEYYADPSLFEYLFLPLGVGGCTYYFAHYDLSEWSQDGMLRGFLRNFAMISIPMLLVPEDVPLADGVVSVLAVYSVVFFAVVTAVVDVLDTDGEGDGGDEDCEVEDANRGTPTGVVDAD